MANTNTPVTDLEIAQARGDAWRDKYNADTDLIYQLRCMVRDFSNAFVASGYKPVEKSDNPGETLLFRGLELLANPQESVSDRARLDWLDEQGFAYGFEDSIEGYRWMIEGPYTGIRRAIDAAIAALDSEESK